MKYKSAVAFRQALEQRIAIANREQRLSHIRLRKLVVFDRFLARLVTVASEGWVLKGGVALNLRFDQLTRTTKDLDLSRPDAEEAATDHMLTAAALDLGDYFTFSVERTTKLGGMNEGTAVSYHVISELAGRKFEDITVDIGFGDPWEPAPDLVRGVTLLEFAGIERIIIPTVALEQHLAEKIHAYTRKYDTGRNSRVKDLVDIVLILQHDKPNAGRLRAALASIFNSRNTHPQPSNIPPPPSEWSTAYRVLIAEIGIVQNDEDGSALLDGYERARHLLDPVLGGAVDADYHWDPSRQHWTL